MIKLAISGCCGRMGSRIAALAVQDNDIEITGAIEVKDNANIGKGLGGILGIDGLKVKITSNPEEAMRKSNVLIEFTSQEATLKHLEIALRGKKAMIIGTTGIDEGGLEKITDASKKIPIVFAPNMSIGVNLLFNLAKTTAAVLKDSQVSMTEAHHKHKKDAPSGTATNLAQVIKGVKGKIDLPIKSIREGEVIGDHTVIFDGEFETLELSHRAKSRDVFASGALIAAKYITGKDKGLYNMQDVLRNELEGKG